MLKKFGMVTVGVTAGLLAVAPMASASDHGADQDGNGNISCVNNGGDFESTSSEGELLDIAGGPIASGNNGNLISCNSILNGNAVSVGVLGDALAGTDLDS